MYFLKLVLLFSQVSEQIKKIFESCRQGDAVYKNKLILRDKVREVLRVSIQYSSFWDCCSMAVATKCFMTVQRCLV